MHISYFGYLRFRTLLDVQRWPTLGHLERIATWLSPRSFSPHSQDHNRSFIQFCSKFGCNLLQVNVAPCNWSQNSVFARHYLRGSWTAARSLTTIQISITTLNENLLYFPQHLVKSACLSSALEKIILKNFKEDTRIKKYNVLKY